MLFDSPVILTDAIKTMIAKHIMPTALDSAGIRALDAGLRRQAMFSAQTTLDYLLSGYKDKITSILNPQQVLRPGELRSVTEGYNPASARVAIKELLRENGYAPNEGEAGTIKDLSSDARIDLIIRTNTELAQGAGSFVQQNDPDVVEDWPALELVRYEDRKEPRDWDTRWRNACEVAGDAVALGVWGHTGRMIALKSSGVWQALGDGAGGYTDTLGNPYPPFAFSSGMWTDEVSYNEALEVGLIKKGYKPRGAEFDFGDLFDTEGDGE